ncbi:MAG TPA: GatB/YqeY domain-containing protein [Syntrophales bacterium]|nr:GatB/YqeY domain-containing protein [Syntrophales bacterium]
MNYKETIERGMVQAAKAQDKERLSALRLIKNTLHNREIDLHRELEDTEFLQAMAAMAKQRNDSIEQFKNGGRQDLVEKETRELKVIQEFLPSQLSEEEVGREIEAAIAEARATGLRDMGKVMKILMPRLTGKADGKLVGDKVKARLSI